MSNEKDKNKPSFLRILVDMILVCLTSGLWLIWIIIRYLRSNS